MAGGLFARHSAQVVTIAGRQSLIGVTELNAVSARWRRTSHHHRYRSWDEGPQEDDGIRQLASCAARILCG